MISIIALLIAILLPALGAARRTARDMTCLSNQRQQGIGMHIYLTEQEYFPYGLHRAAIDPDDDDHKTTWHRLIYSSMTGQGYTIADTTGIEAGEMEMFKCPSVQIENGRFHHIANDSVFTDSNGNDAPPVKVDKVQRTSEIVAAFDGPQRSWGDTDGTAWQMNVAAPGDLNTYSGHGQNYWQKGNATWEPRYDDPLNKGGNGDQVGGTWPTPESYTRATFRWRHAADERCNFLFTDGHATGATPDTLTLGQLVRDIQ